VPGIAADAGGEHQRHLQAVSGRETVGKSIVVIIVEQSRKSRRGWTAR
jgi:hypothetical protein